MRFYASLNKITINKEKLDRDIYKVIDESFYDAIESFGQEAARAVPIHTGMARGSFLNLRAFLERHGRTISAIPEIPQALLKSGKPYRYVHTKSIKGKSNFTKTPYTAKTRFSTKSTQVYKRKGYIPNFTYETRVKHYNLNDTNTMITVASSPWYSFDTGKLAFISTLKEAIKVRQLTKLKDYLLVSTITQGSESGIQPFRNRSRNKL